MKKTNREPRLSEYRVRYNAGSDQSAVDSYHYYNALSADQALDFHLSMMERKGFNGQTISVEKKNPYADKWEDRSHVISENKPNI